MHCWETKSRLTTGRMSSLIKLCKWLEKEKEGTKCRTKFSHRMAVINAKK